MIKDLSTQVNELTGKGWRIVSDGPSGVQLEGPKKMRGLDVAAAVLGGVLLLFAWPIGVGLILIAVVDYLAFTKPEKRFLPRS